MSPIIYKM